MPTSITSSGITFDDATTLTTGIVPTANIADAAVTPAKLSQPLTPSTSVATTSGTSIDFTGIPSWVKRITVMFNAVSTSGSSSMLIQLGDAGGFETTNYNGGAARLTETAVNAATTTAGFAFNTSNAATLFGGTAVITNVTGNTWTAFGCLGGSATQFVAITAGSKTLSDTLDRVRLTTVVGTDTFDAGSVNIIYEG